MAIRSYPMPDPPKAPAKRATSPAAGCLALVGVVFLLVSVGPLIVLLNGGYSIVGMSYLADKIGPYGRMFWAVATFWTVEVPIAARAGLPLAQPVLPWLMVLGISALEVALVLYQMRHSDPGNVVGGAGLVASAFDYVTTAAGLIFAPFTATLGAAWYVWIPIAAALAVPITFSFEWLLARALRGR